MNSMFFPLHLLRFVALMLILVVCGIQSLVAAAEDRNPNALEKVDVQQKLGSKLASDLSFTDHQGNRYNLNDLFLSSKPVLLTLNYVRCANMCSLQLQELANSLKKLPVVPGQDFELVTVSIDPSDTAHMASQKRDGLLKLVDHPKADWKFLTGDETSINALASSVGFSYSYDKTTSQFGHAAVLFFLTPKAVISKYLFGVVYNPRDIHFALMESSLGKMGSFSEKLLLRCFHFDIASGRYTPFAIDFMRVGGVICLICLSIWLAALWKREKLKSNQKELFA